MLMNRRKYLAVVVATGVGLAGCSGSDGGGGQNNEGGSNTGTTVMNETTANRTETTSSTNSPTESTTAERTSTDQASTTEAETATPSGGGEGSAEVVSSELVVSEGQYSTDIFMTGLIENTGSGVLRVPEARIAFCDGEDSILDSSTASIAFLKEGRRWEVHEPYFDDTEPARGEIDVMSTETFQTELGIPDELELAESELQSGEEPSLSLRVENTSSDAVSPAVFAVFYGEDGIECVT
jgi:hypothetical protein